MMKFWVHCFLFPVLVFLADATDPLGNITVQQQLKKSVLAFLGTLEPGICAQVVLNATVREQYISKSLMGRVLPVGTFPTAETAMEYLYGILCEIPGLPSRGQVLISTDLLHLTYDPDCYRASFKVQVNLKSRKQLIFFGILAFDHQWKLCGYEAVIQNVGLTIDIDSKLHNSTIQGLCNGIQNICPTGSANHQYASVKECISFLSSPQIPFGSYDRADQNNVVCRLIHLLLAQIAPEIHCPHLGKTGGGACSNKSPKYYFTDVTDFVQCAHRYRN